MIIKCNRKLFHFYRDLIHDEYEIATRIHRSGIPIEIALPPYTRECIMREAENEFDRKILDKQYKLLQILHRKGIYHEKVI